MPVCLERYLLHLGLLAGWTEKPKPGEPEVAQITPNAQMSQIDLIGVVDMHRLFTMGAKGILFVPIDISMQEISPQA